MNILKTTRSRAVIFIVTFNRHLITTSNFKVIKTLKSLALALQSLESPSSIDDVLRPSDIGWLQHNKNLELFYHDFCWTRVCVWLPPQWKVRWSHMLQHTQTHLIWGQVYTQMCHLFSRAHSTSFLSCHKVLKSLGRRRSRAFVSSSSHQPTEESVPVLGQPGPGSFL